MTVFEKDLYSSVSVWLYLRRVYDCIEKDLYSSAPVWLYLRRVYDCI